MKRKIKIITSSYIYFTPIIKNYNFHVYSEFRTISFSYKVIRKFSKSIIPEHYWYNKWKNEINNGDTVIIHASNHSEDIIDFLQSRFSEIRIIHWFWNPVAVYKNIKLVKKNCELWSFDKKDCEKYNMQFNTTHYFKALELPASNIISDIFFFGFDKGRKVYIDSLEKKMFNLGIKTDFTVLNNNSKETIPYSNILLKIAENKAILDIVQKGQNGLTLRTMESIFLKKKLVTSYKPIQEEDFYNPNNIFILDVDPLSDLPQFLSKPYYDIPASILSKYDVINWAKRFNID